MGEYGTNGYDEPEIQEPTAGPAPESREHAPEVKPERKAKKAKRPSSAKGVARRDVERVLDAEAKLDDEGVRTVVALFAADDSRPALVAALLDGSAAGPVGLLVDANGETDDVERTVMLAGAVQKDPKTVRAAARVAVALEPELADGLKPSLKDLDLAAGLARVAPLLDVRGVSALVGA